MVATLPTEDGARAREQDTKSAESGVRLRSRIEIQTPERIVAERLFGSFGAVALVDLLFTADEVSTSFRSYQFAQDMMEGAQSSL